jgi:DeoR family fructose operon transcriptional repressor
LEEGIEVSLIGEERKSMILDILEMRDKASVSYLAAKLDVTTETIRRYLEQLEQEKKLKKVYGGAIRALPAQEEPSYFTREITFSEEKKGIGKKAAEFVEDNDVIAIDEGSTPLQMIKYLLDKQNLTVITSSFSAAVLLMEYETSQLFSGKIIFLGGTVNAKHKRSTGSFAEKMMDRLYVNKAFLSVDGISMKYGITVFDPEKGTLSRKLMEQAQETYALVDHSKLEVRSLHKMASIDEIHTIVCDQDAPDDWKDQLVASNTIWEVVGK